MKDVEPAPWVPSNVGAWSEWTKVVRVLRTFAGHCIDVLGAESPKRYTKAEAAKVLGVSERQLQRDIAKLGLPKLRRYGRSKGYTDMDLLLAKQAYKGKRR